MYLKICNSFLRYNSHTIPFTHLNLVIHWFLVYLQNSVTICTIKFRTLHHPQKKAYTYVYEQSTTY